MHTETENLATTLPVRWLTTVEMADRLRIHPATMSKWARMRIVSCLETRDGYRFDPEVVEAELAQPSRRAG